jgi:MFS family permease
MAMMIAVERTRVSDSEVPSTTPAPSAWHMIGGALLGGVGVGSVAVIDALLLDLARCPAQFSIVAELRRSVASPVVAYFVVIGALLGSLFGLAHSAHQA